MNKALPVTGTYKLYMYQHHEVERKPIYKQMLLEGPYRETDSPMLRVSEEQDTVSSHIVII